ncbi:hypothetical protein HPB50_016959 [Hyalomma asiaticum]|uniref:Uncharacterized protein n=1 Tax=Hyalomma asiaticum TaxID=266040 RepID=A0ACB7SQV1_HYAAI|nr:hypothetical protein HPB50_016959 [Hyalomma asiaticum]
MLLARSPTILISLCQNFDELRHQRSIARQKVLQANSILGIAVSNAQPDDCSVSTEINFIREEVARQLSLLPHSHIPPDAPLISPLEQAIPTATCEAIPPITTTTLPPPWLCHRPMPTLPLNLSRSTALLW